MEKISSSFKSRNVEIYCSAFSKLTHIFKRIGCIRCFYVCEMVNELKLTYDENQSNKLNIDGDCINEIWKYYQALIEYLAQYLKYLDFEFNFSVRIEKKTPKFLDANNTRYFSDLIASIPLFSGFKVVELRGEFYCL